MNQFDLAWRVAVLVISLASLTLYTRGWRRLRSGAPSLARVSRLVAFILAAAFACAALASPLAALSQTHFLARTVQQILLCIAAPPLFWLACSFHVMAWGAPVRSRRWSARWLVRPSRLEPYLRGVMFPGVVWFIYLCNIVLWYDPAFVAATVPHPWVRMASLIWLFVVSLFFWQQITGNGPRRYTRAGFAARLAMLVTIEIANVVTGVTIAFAVAPIYEAYSAASGLNSAFLDSFIPAVADQFLGGILTWIFGSIVYIASAVLVLNQIFRREGSEHPQPPPNWDAEEKFIMPGLEDRLRDVRWERHDWKKH